MRSRRETLLSAADKLASSSTAQLRCLVGFDGFIDDIIDVVDVRRSMRRDDYTRLETMEAYAARVQAFARRSMNLELVVKESRFGGNGPLMAGG
ncbi:MAG: carbohydrate kinase family protein, partial [Phycisphaerales bacterium]|nr:carbohydrate kinase family protein [Phycisphaerales bacterium]